LANSNAVTALLAGPSQSSAVMGVTRKTQTFGSSGPRHQHCRSISRSPRPWRGREAPVRVP
jgi:hypothetical protein